MTELANDNSLFRLEEQYETAAWESTVASLSLLWTDELYHNNAKHIPYSVQRLAQAAFKDPSQILPMAQTVSDSNIFDEFRTIGIVVPSKQRSSESFTQLMPNPMFTLMHYINYEKDSVLDEITNDVNIARFHKDISSLALYNQARLRRALIYPETIAEAIAQVQHDNLFYIGLWDGDRSLRISED